MYRQCLGLVSKIAHGVFDRRVGKDSQFSRTITWGWKICCDECGKMPNQEEVAPTHLFLHMIRDDPDAAPASTLRCEPALFLFAITRRRLRLVMPDEASAIKKSVEYRNVEGQQWLSTRRWPGDFPDSRCGL